MKIFGIGLSKTGTTSLAQALRILGYSVTEGRTHEIAENDCGTDLDFAAAFKDLDRDYPGSRFIYTQRDIEPWLMSCCQHWRAAGLQRPTGRTQQITVFDKIYGRPDFDETAFREAYGRHEKDVLSYFKDRKQDLMVWNLCAEPGWERLCSFLRKPVPDTPFPWANTKAGPALYYKRRLFGAVTRLVLMLRPGY